MNSDDVVVWHVVLFVVLFGCFRALQRKTEDMFYSVVSGRQFGRDELLGALRRPSGSTGYSRRCPHLHSGCCWISGSGGNPPGFRTASHNWTMILILMQLQVAIKDAVLKDIERCCQSTIKTSGKESIHKAFHAIHMSNRFNPSTEV